MHYKEVPLQLLYVTLTKAFVICLVLQTILIFVSQNLALWIKDKHFENHHFQTSAPMLLNCEWDIFIYIVLIWMSISTWNHNELILNAHSDIPGVIVYSSKWRRNYFQLEIAIQFHKYLQRNGK